MSDSFTPKLGRIGWRHGTRLDRYVNKVMRAAQTAGHVGKSSSAFTGSRIGRGSAFGTLAGAGLFAGGQRRVIVKALITKLRHGDLGAARAHLRYIQRDGVTRDGDPGELYGREGDDVDGKSFLDKCDGDRHQFRLIVSPDDGTELADLKPFIRDLMIKVEQDLGTKLDWVAVDHFNTGHPHTHIVIRGRDDTGADLVIAKDYMSHGLRMRARELVTLELGPEIETDLTFKLAREVDTDRFTRLDRALLRHTDRGVLVVSAMPPTDHATHAAHMGRLRKLETLGLAQEYQTGVWGIDPDAERKLRSLGARTDIIQTMHRVMKETGIDRPAGSYAVFDIAKPGNRIVGRVAGLGLTDEISDRHYVVIDGTDGKVHYADIGHIAPVHVPEKGMIVAVENRATEADAQTRARLRILSYLRLEQLVEANGATWLDKEVIAQNSLHIAEHGFGSQASAALQRRRQWLVAQGLGQVDSEGAFRAAPNLLNKLRARELQQASAMISKELGLPYAELIEGERVNGTYIHSTNLASGKYAIIGKAQEFLLVPWRQEMERHLGKPISGTVTSQGITWDLGSKRQQGLRIGA
jgi:type IV secretory pathway VirD2 relaxase